jgi:hypothetical protein
MIPRWLITKRHDVCRVCPEKRECQDTFTILNDDPTCRLDKQPPLAKELLWAKAWPQEVAAISGCCDAVG